MNTKAAAICLFASSLALGPEKQDFADVDYEIYSKVLRQHFASDRPKNIVIGDHTLMDFPPVLMATTQFGGSPEVKKLHAELTKDTIKDYDMKNKLSVALENRFSPDLPVVLLSASDRDRIFGVRGEGDDKRSGPNGFDRLNAEYPGAHEFIHISRIGFSSDGSQALVYVGYVCGGLCGQGQFFLLVKEGAGWKITRTATTWVS